jgi:alpha-ribazole phosphatase/probable phosphoglycerate mutase
VWLSSPLARRGRVQETEAALQTVEIEAAIRADRLEWPFLGGQSYRRVPDTTRALLDDPAEEWDGATLLTITRPANRRAFQSSLGGADLEALLRNPPPWRWLALYRPPTRTVM